MLDLSQNLIIAIIVGPGIAAAIGLAIWFVRRTFHQQDRAIEKQDKEIEKMAVTQKEIGQRLVNVLTEQGKLGERLEERFNGLSARMADFQQNVNRVEGHMSEMRSNMQSMQRDVDGAQTAIRYHREYVDSEIAGLRELLDDKGRNGAG